jgi:hypothetical protein
MRIVTSSLCALKISLLAACSNPAPETADAGPDAGPEASIVGSWTRDVNGIEDRWTFGADGRFIYQDGPAIEEGSFSVGSTITLDFEGATARTWVIPFTLTETELGLLSFRLIGDTADAPVGSWWLVQENGMGVMTREDLELRADQGCTLSYSNNLNTSVDVLEGTWTSRDPDSIELSLIDPDGEPVFWPLYYSLDRRALVHRLYQRDLP